MYCLNNKEYHNFYCHYFMISGMKDDDKVESKKKCKPCLSFETFLMSHLSCSY